MNLVVSSAEKSSITRTKEHHWSMLQNWAAKITLAATSIGCVMGMTSLSAWAEGTAQLGLNQPIFDYPDPNNFLLNNVTRPLYVDIVSPGEVINISVCGENDTQNINVQVFATIAGFEPTAQPTATGLALLNQTTTGSNVPCNDLLTSPLTNPIRFTAPTAGTYEIRLDNLSGSLLNRVDITVTPNTVTNPDPTERQGRLYSYNWAFSAGDFAETAAADTDYFVKVPGGRPGENYVWKLDLNNFAGFVYEILSNNIGVNAPNSGLSTPFTGNSVNRLYPEYLSYPAIVGTRPVNPPSILSFSFTDDANVDNSISPGSTPGVQDSGTFEFTTDVDGTYSIAIDINGSGAPDAGDVFLNGTTTPGLNTVTWNGRDNNNQVLPSGTYNALLSVRQGEFHFVAGDAETSGGGTNNGLTVFEATSQTGTLSTSVFYDDFTLLSSAGGTSNLPTGGLSGTPAGTHTWGDFTSGGFGNQRYIDTYVFGAATGIISPVVIETSDTPAIDFGDAPDSYGDASHNISSSLYLGSAAPDREADTQLGTDAGAGADGDDGDGTDDEDGVTFSPSLSFPDTVHVVQAGISNTVDVNASDTGVLNAWIDYNQDGDFDDTGEQIFTDENLSAGSNSISFTPDITLLHGTTYARFRFGSQTGLGPTGSATDGEVEDYEVNIASPVTDINACAVTGLVDGEFELLDIAQASPTPVRSFGSVPTVSRQYNETDVPGWNFAGTTTPTPLDDIEIWQSLHGGGSTPFNAFEGGQHAEINAEENGALFQDVVTTPGASMGWQFAHRGRTGNDSMEFRLGPPGATVSQGTFTSGNNVNDPNEGWKLYNGTYTVPAGQYITRVELRSTATANGNITTGNFIDTVEFTLPPCIPPYDPNLLLVKRITKINGGTTSVAGDNLAAYKQEEAYVYDDNTIEAATPPDTDKWPNTTGKASSTFLIGGTDGGRTRPGDEVEYTIYFLSTGNIDAADVQLCDKVPDFQSYVPDAYNSVTPGPSGGVGANRGMLVEYNGNTFSYTNDADGDIAQFFPPGSALPAACNGTAPQTEDNGAIVINLGNLPNATSAGTPTTSYGAVRFRATVK